jgi:hypothetical protein
MTDTISETSDSENQQHPAWWICTVWIEAPEKPAEFVYGIAAQCHRQLQKVQKKELLKAASWSLAQHEAILSDEQFLGVIAKVAQGTMNFDTSVAGEFGPLVIATTRYFIGRCLGHTAASIASHATCATPSALASDRDSWTSVLKTLESELGLSFTSENADRIGCFEVATLQPWLDQAPPVLIEAIVPNTETHLTDGVRQLQICRTAEFSAARQLAHVVCFSEERRLIDRVITLEPGQRRSAPIEAPHPVERFEFNLFSESGELLHRESASFFGSLQLNMGIQSRRLQLEDDLARRANSHRRRGEEPCGLVTSVTHQRSLSTFEPVNEHWARHRLRMLALRRSCFPPKSQDKWFSRSLDDELGVIAHFDKLLSGGNIRAAVLVDPFFGADALRRFALRLSSADVKITIITSWNSTDPDTGIPLANPTSSITELEMWMRSIRQFINPRLTLVNLVSSSDQAFHDRYLLLYPHEGDPQVYLLSNSINAMAANWPFCMSLLADDVRQRAQAYIEGLCKGVDITSATKPKITFQWPSEA